VHLSVKHADWKDLEKLESGLFFSFLPVRWNLTRGTSHKKYDLEPLKILMLGFSRMRRDMANRRAAVPTPYCKAVVCGAFRFPGEPCGSPARETPTVPHFTRLLLTSHVIARPVHSPRYALGCPARATLVEKLRRT
jgi:hypothetical protein